MPATNARNVSITDEQDLFVNQLVDSGRYASASEVFRQGLRLLQREEEARRLEEWIVGGLTRDEAGRLKPGTAKRLREKLLAELRSGMEQTQSGQGAGSEARRGDAGNAAESMKELARLKKDMKAAVGKGKKRSKATKRG